jgi:hypothetical protein
MRSSSASYGYSSEMSSEMLATYSSEFVSSVSSGSSLSSAPFACDDFQTDPRGREGIGVVQPQSGVDYPLIDPSEDIRYLLADLYLEHVGVYRPPFHIRYMHGFGCLPGIPAGIPPHPVVLMPYNIVIVDATNHVVYDTRDANDIKIRDWGPRNRIYEWHLQGRTLRAVIHTAWSPDNDPEPRQYGHHIIPQSAVIDSRAIHVIPSRVSSINAVLDSITAKRVDLQAGYNMVVTHQAVKIADGGRVKHQIRFDAMPGAGDGVFPDCDPPPLAITKINSIAPTAAGDFHLAAADCFGLRRPTQIIRDDSLVFARPVTMLSPGNDTLSEEPLPDSRAGTTTAARGWPESKQYGHLQLTNDCKACCDCDDYIAVARYMNRVAGDYKQIGNSIMASRGIYHENRQRFLKHAACINSRPLRIFMQPQICPFIDIAGQYSNHTEECLSDLTITFQLSASPDDMATVVPGYTLITGASRKPGRRSGLTERYTLQGAWPTFTAHWDSVEPFASVSVRFRLEFPECFVPYVVTARITGELDGAPIDIGDSGDSSSSSGGGGSPTSDTKILNCPAVPDDAQDLLRCYIAMLSSSSEFP